MTPLEQIAQLQALVEKLEKEKKELVRELNFKKAIEKEAVHRYGLVADELLMYYIHYGKIDVKEMKKK